MKKLFLIDVLRMIKKILKKNNIQTSKPIQLNPITPQIISSPTPTIIPSPQKKVTLSATESSLLFKITDLQQAAGTWQLNDSLAQIVGKPLSIIIAAIPSGISHIIWATAIAVEFLEIKFNAVRDDWSLLAEKAIKWLRNELASINNSYDAINQEVKKLLI